MHDWMCIVLQKKEEKTNMETVWLYVICWWKTSQADARDIPVCFRRLEMGGGDWEASVKGPVVVCDRGGISSWRVFCAPLAVSKVMCPGC